MRNEVEKCSGEEKPSVSAIFEMLRFANAAASIITTRKGALKVMPTESEIAAVIK